MYLYCTPFLPGTKHIYPLTHGGAEVPSELRWKRGISRSEMYDRFFSAAMKLLGSDEDAELLQYTGHDLAWYSKKHLLWKRLFAREIQAMDGQKKRLLDAKSLLYFVRGVLRGL